MEQIVQNQWENIFRKMGKYITKSVQVNSFYIFSYIQLLNSIYNKIKLNSKETPNSIYNN